MEWLSRVNWVDVLFIIIILRNIYVGSQRGFFSELFNILGICVSMVVGVHFYAQTAGLLNKYLLLPLNIGDLIGFLLVSFCVYFLFRLTLGILKKIMKVELLPGFNKFIDKIGGPLIGVCKGIAVSLFVFLILLLIPVEYVVNSAKTNSLSGEYLAKAADVLYNKSVQVIPNVKPANTQLLLKGAEPIRLKWLELEKKDKLDEVVR